MQIYFEQNLAFLAVPKTGTTAIEMALRKHAHMIFSRSRKHITAGHFHNKVAPFLVQFADLRPERFAVMRDPLDQIRSWYRYRNQLPAKNRYSTAQICFDSFVQAVISDDPPPYAGIGSQYHFLSMRNGKIPLHHLFAYDQSDVLLGFLRARFGQDLDIPQRNQSPEADTCLSPGIEHALRIVRMKDFDLYHRIQDAGGHLKPFKG